MVLMVDGSKHLNLTKVRDPGTIYLCYLTLGRWSPNPYFSDFGTAVGKAYGAFYTTGSIPQDQAKLIAPRDRILSAMIVYFSSDPKMLNFK